MAKREESAKISSTSWNSVDGAGVLLLDDEELPGVTATVTGVSLTGVIELTMLSATVAGSGPRATVSELLLLL